MSEANSDVHEILNLDEASRYLRIKRRTIYTLAARRMIPATKIGGQWRFRKSQLDALFEGSRRMTSEQAEGVGALLRGAEKVTR